MTTTDSRIDAYIERSADFAKPILQHLRKVIHKTCPEVVETMKWSFPHFNYHGSILCSMASFKKHCAFVFWLGAAMKDTESVFETAGENTAMGQLGQIKSISDLPAEKTLTSYLREAMDLIDKGVKLRRKIPETAAKELAVPDYFLAELKKNKKALATFDAFPYSHKKEYLDWITEAKTEATRQKRMATAIEWITEGKGRNWRYEKK